jgi:hypothetical protein
MTKAASYVRVKELKAKYPSNFNPENIVEDVNARNKVNAEKSQTELKQMAEDRM